MDNSKVKKVATFKSGNFIFSSNFNNDSLRDFLTKIYVLYETIQDLPIWPTLLAKIKEEIIRKSIFGTAALEGNPLSEEQVGDLISDKFVKTKEQAEVEIKNLKTVYDFLEKYQPADADFHINEDIIRKIHEILTKDVKYQGNTPGQYRNHPVKVGDAEHGGVYTPPKCYDDIKNLMQEFVTWINSKEISELKPEIRASLAHYHFAMIHPFADGNGRTARIIEAMLLRLAGIKFVPPMLSNYYYLNMDEYFNVFSAARKNQQNDITAFLEFTLKGVVASLDNIKQRITLVIRFYTLRDYYNQLKDSKALTQRQCDLLCILVDAKYFKNFSLKSLFNEPQFRGLYKKVNERTARRDLIKLSKMKLITLDENKEYVWNLRALEEAL